MTIILVTGAAKSGKSEWAESLAKSTEKSVIYVATAQRNELDKEWNDKIIEHQKRRPLHWQTWEIPYNLPQNLLSIPDDYCVLIDSLGTWVANELDKTASDWEETVEELLKNINNISSEIIFVAEETAWGVVPSYESGRLFRNRLGNLIRRVGSIADTVYLTIGGYAVNISVLGVKLT